ncbi:sensor histidine kinase [Gordonia jinghuaiqii]|uniref:histidine kinase n=1 Tax=Gordonia jinghuaiqii TaxID=2758710 RepID=A0A7D7LZ86_9ACTN|nr:histidine kinase [Gordonia jinghuaiqii]MCR5977030.1 sensor histidine kinase [Gordonia jinghuaiqii]QMT03955.1 sensor histidine kinase [Gordonia jinghuaiqii]
MFGYRRHLRAAGTDLVQWASTAPVAQDPAVRSYFASRINWFFLFVAVVMYSISWPTLMLTHSVPAFALPVIAAFAALPIAFAWSAPLAAWTVSVVSAQLIGILVPAHDSWDLAIQVTHFIEVLVLTFMAFLRCPLRWVPVVWVSTGLVVAYAVQPTARVGWIVGISVLAVVVALLRGLMASRRQLAARTRQTEAAEAESAVLQERTRIARDLHDVVAHRMSMVVVMSQTARYRLPDVSPSAAAEFDAIADAARISLDEVRQLLGVLRVEGVDTDAMPNPGLAELDSLVAETRRAGADVALTLDVDATAVGESAALVIYRIVQESLANATRHAPGGRVEVAVTGGPDDLVEVAVVNSAATGEPLRIGGSGVGISGMIDRAKAVGGSLSATPTPAGGFAVRARIPAVPRRGGGVVDGASLTHVTGPVEPPRAER